jgi:acetate kinase
MDALVLVANPGSASRKYALYSGNLLRGSLHFEFEKGRVVCTIQCGAVKNKLKINASDFRLATKHLINILYKTKMMHPREQIRAVGVRVVAPGEFFTGDHLVNQVFIKELEGVRFDAPLHIMVVLEEIRELARLFPQTDIVAVSDSAFHAGRPAKTSSYAIDAKLAAQTGVRRWGYHGISLRAVVGALRQDKRFAKLGKVVVAHLGSGCSVTALRDWQSFDTSMGYSPLEGLMSATRSGSLDISAAVKLKKTLDFNDRQLEEYLNKKSGLLAVSEKSDDIRELQKLEITGDKKAALALDMFIYRAVGEIGKMITALGGADALVFTGTVGERSFYVRGRIIEGLNFLGFRVKEKVNMATVDPPTITEISTRKSPYILVVPTDENREIARRTLEFIS